MCYTHSPYYPYAPLPKTHDDALIAMAVGGFIGALVLFGIYILVHQ